MGSQVSRPLQIVLGLVVLVAVLWMVALRPKSGGSKNTTTPAASATQTTPTTPSGPTAPGVKGLTGAIQQAHGAVTTSQGNADALNQASAQAGAPNPTTSSSSASPAPGAATPSSTSSATTKSSAHHGKTAAHHGKTPMLARRPPVVLPRARAPKVAAQTLNSHRVLALLFYNPRAADDRAVLRSFAHLSRHGGKVTVIAASLDHVADFDAVTTKVAVTGSPTFVVFDRQGQPTKLVGF
ncbi:MAG TPA: hypothetical protein VGI54_10575, partial [Solirubrobacteraceae bacterium]